MTKLYLTENKKAFEKIFIISPPILSSLIVLIAFSLDMAPKNTNPLTWLLIVVFIDVAHVWSSLFRTYLSKEGMRKWRKPLMLIPMVCYFFGVFLHAFGPKVFWMGLAYFAVFHFIRQQYGFIKLYSKAGQSSSINPGLEKLTIYSACLIPILIWHLSGPQKFFWFVPEDFLYFESQSLVTVLKVIGPSILFYYLFMVVRKSNVAALASPKVLIILGTYLAWWSGIVWVATDWAFTITNVISHGIPYFALILINHFTKDKSSDLYFFNSDQWQKLPRPFIIASALLLVFSLAYIEEGLWDSFLWHDHNEYFKWFLRDLYNKGPITELGLQSFLIPLLALPQTTHYALDGLIWRRQ